MSSKHDFSVIEGKAQYAFRNIQSRSAHIVSQLQKVVGILLNEKPEDIEFTGGAITLARMTLPNLTIGDIEENIQHWQFHIPENPAVRAALWRLFGENFALKETEIPQMLEQLGFADKDVQEAFEKESGKSIQSIFEMKSAATDSKEKIPATPVMEDLIVKLEWLFVRRGETLFKQGDEPDAIYIVVDGMFHIMIAQDGEEIFLAESGRNEIIGEIALITNQPRTASVYATRDSQVCKLSKEDFNLLLQKHDILRSLIMQQIIDRLRNDEVGQRLSYPVPRVITLVPICEGTEEFGVEFARRLGRKANVLFLNRAVIKNKVPKTMARALESHSHDYEFNSWLEDQEVEYDFVIYQTDLDYTLWTERAIQRAERILFIGRAGENPDQTEAEIRIKENEENHLAVKKELILLHEPGKAPQGTIRWLRERKVDQHHHIQIGHQPDYLRVFRLLFGLGTGLVLGGGGLRGAAHAGVWRSITELDLDVDAIGGTSAGAIAGALFAMGKSHAETLSITSEVLIKRPVLLDYTFPITSLNAGRKITEAFESIYGDLQIEDLPIPFFCVSTNLTQATSMIHKTGSLAKHIRASTSLPGIYPPVVDEHDNLLVDGAVMNNLPIKEMLDIVRGGQIIAVDVGKGQEATRAYGYTNSVSGWQILWRRLNPFQKTMVVPNILETITQTSMLASQVDAEELHSLADVIVRPDISQTALFDIDSLDMLYNQGYEASRNLLADWKKRLTRDL